MENDSMTERIRKSNQAESNTFLGEESAECSENSKAPKTFLPPSIVEQGGLGLAESQLRIFATIKAECSSHTGPRSPAIPPNPPANAPIFEAPIPATLEYFHSLGIDMLSEDIVFVKKLVPRATISRNSAIRSYIEIWRAAYQAESVQHRQSNKARFSANQWLREEATRINEKVLP
jgi:hypothetical protein